MRLAPARISIGLALAVGIVAVTHLVAGIGDGVTMLTPALLLLAPLLAGRYVGEQTIHRARCRRQAPRRRRPARRSVLHRARAVLVPRGGLLLAASLATRPPPAVV